MEEIRAPWTPEQVAALNKFQQRMQFHPFTCGGAAHEFQPPVLIADTDGWHCPTDCNYQQDWAPAYMAVAADWPRPFGERHGPTPQETQAAVRAIHALRSPAPEGSEHYRSGWDTGLEAAMDAVRDLAPAVPTVSADVFTERLVQALTEAAFECDGVDCGQTEQECWDNHPIRWTATSRGVTSLDGSTVAIAAVALKVARELGLIPK